MITAHLGLGSDVGDRVGWLRRAVGLLREAGLQVGAVSSLYLTEPVGDPTLPWFLNCALEIRHPPAPEGLLELCLQVEAACGRQRSSSAGNDAGGGSRSRAGAGDPTHLSAPPSSATASDATPPPPHATPPTPLPRTLDIDILLYDRERIVTRGLQVPHPRLHRRRFVLRPLAEIAPDAVHPVRGTTVAQMLGELEEGEGVWLLAPFPGVER